MELCKYLSYKQGKGAVPTGLTRIISLGLMLRILAKEILHVGWPY